MSGAHRSDLLRLHDILAAVAEIEEFTSVSRGDFLKSMLRRRAVEKDLEIIGESARQLSPAIKHRHSEVEWKMLETLRHRLVHEYFRSDPEELWRIATKDLPAVRERLRKVRSHYAAGNARGS
jgi:uncharacterized protein with HEPN domain